MRGPLNTGHIKVPMKFRENTKRGHIEVPIYSLVVCAYRGHKKVPTIIRNIFQIIPNNCKYPYNP